MKILTYIFVAILIIAVVCFIVNASIEAGKTEVYEWAKENKMQVEKIETHMTTFNTPFYYLNKGSYIYEVDMTNGEKWWVRTGVFSNDYEKDKNQ